MKKIFALLMILIFGFGFALAQVIENDTSIPAEGTDLSDSVVVVASAGATGPAILQGIWIEAMSHNTSIIRDVATGEKSGYEYDKNVLETKANWWFWGDINKYLQLNAEVGVWNIKHTMYKANSYGANVPDVTWGDGFQTLFGMFFAPIHGLNGETPGVFNKVGFSVKTPWVVTRFGYGNLKENGMSKFTGIYNVLDRWNDVGKGYVEFTNGNKAKHLGDKVDLNVLVALSRMRAEYGMYSILGLKIADKFETDLTFTSTTMSSELFRYNEQNDNAASLYMAFEANDNVKIDAHGLIYFGQSTPVSAETLAGALRGQFKFGANTLSVTGSYAGEKAQTVWGYDDTVCADSIDTALEYWYKNDTVGIGLDAGANFGDVGSLSDGLWNIRMQPMFDFNFEKFAGNDITAKTYGVFNLDRMDKATDEKQRLAYWFEEAGFEVVVAELPTLKKLVVDYAAVHKNDYRSWDDGYKYSVWYNSLMCRADISSELSCTFGGIFRVFKDTSVKTNQPIGLACGVDIKTDIKFLGKPRFWMHITYGMDPYEDVNYDLYRADNPQEHPAHRTFKLNSLDHAMTESRISLGLIWDLK